MGELIKISNQKFYYSNVDNLKSVLTHLNNCAIVIDEKNIDLFIENYSEYIGTTIHQIIFISEKLNDVLNCLKNKNLYLISAVDLKLSLQFSMMSNELVNNIICVVNEGEKTVENILKEINT